MDALELMRERYSARGFSDAQLTDRQLADILEAGRIAPSAVNKQPWRFLVIQGAEGLAKVDACSKCRYGAPTAVLVCFNIDESAKSPVVPDYGWVDCGLAVMQMALAAKERGVDSCIVGAYDPGEARRQFNLPENIVPYQFLMLGTSTVEPAPRHTDRKALGDIVVRETF